MFAEIVKSLHFTATLSTVALFFAETVTSAATEVPEARMVFVGDTGSGGWRALKVRDALLNVIEDSGASRLFLLGDNVYENGEAESIVLKFVNVYRPVMRLGTTIHAALGNHDVRQCSGTGLRPVPRDASAYKSGARCWAADHLQTPEFGYNGGMRYYSVTIPGDDRVPLVDVFVLDSNTLGRKQTKIGEGGDDAQLEWLIAALSASAARWKIVTLHHPIYSPRRTLCALCGIFKGRGADRMLQEQLEPIFIKHGVNIVFQGHQHMYARLKPQKTHGIRYFVTGGGSKKPYSFKQTDSVYPRSDGGKFNHFVYTRATAERFEYCVIDDEQTVRDSGSFVVGDAEDTTTTGCPTLE